MNHRFTLKHRYKRWMKDSRYREQRRYISWGIVTIIFGLLVSLCLILVSAFSWIVFGVIIFAIGVLLMLWNYINER